MSNSVFTMRSSDADGEHRSTNGSTYEPTGGAEPPAGSRAVSSSSASPVEFETKAGKPKRRPSWLTTRTLRLPGLGRNATIDDAKDMFGPHNSEVTKSYISLSQRMRDCLGVPVSDDGRRANSDHHENQQLVDWCGFASWVSFSLGAFLIPEKNSPALAMHPFLRRQVIGKLLPRLLTTEEWVGLAAGNLQIYREMKALYKLVYSFEGDSLEEALDEADRRTDALWYGDDFQGTEATEADRYWARHAVKSFLLASATTDQHQKSQLMWSASVALSAIEQRRADTQIDDFFEGMIENRRWLPGLFHRPALWLTVRITTRWLTHFLLPDGFISVGRPLTIPDPADYGGGTNSLTEIDNPWARTVLDAFYTEPQPRSTDWTDYGQRMHFIAALFRAYQEVPEVIRFEGPKRSAEPLAAPVATEPLFRRQTTEQLQAVVEATMPEANPPTL